MEKPDEEFLVPHRRNLCIPRNTDFRELRTEIFLQNPTHGEEPEKRTQMRYDSPDCHRLQVISTGHELGQIRRLNLVQCPRSLGMEKIQKDRDFCRTQVKSSRPKVEPILTILFVITKCFLHGRNKMDCLHLREWTFNAPVLSEIVKHLYFERDMLAPAIARLIHLLVPDAIFLEKACHQIRGKLIS